MEKILYDYCDSYSLITKEVPKDEVWCVQDVNSECIEGLHISTEDDSPYANIAKDLGSDIYIFKYKDKIFDIFAYDQPMPYTDVEFVCSKYNLPFLEFSLKGKFDELSNESGLKRPYDNEFMSEKEGEEKEYVRCIIF